MPGLIFERRMDSAGTNLSRMCGGGMPVERILVVRLGAMGDLIHALPAVATLKSSFPEAFLSWAVSPRWRELLAGNPDVDDLILVDRKTAGGVWSAVRRLRHSRFDVAFDFQGLIQSALVARIAPADRRIGFDRSQAREGAAALLYSQTLIARSPHVVDRNLELAASAGATRRTISFPLPDGRPEGHLPAGPFVLASPLAGWASKQWPLEYYTQLAAMLRNQCGMPLVVNGAPSASGVLGSIGGAIVHTSSIPGLIDATRRATAVVGVDSGPLHLAAALGKPGVAVFGPTDPARNGPYGETLGVLRSPNAATTYQRGSEDSAAMRAITPESVLSFLQRRL
jgi:heptosyltransferase I